MESDGFSFYTVSVDFGTLTNLISRFGSGSYHLYAVIAELILIGLMVNWCAGVLHGTRGTRLLRGLLVVLVVATLVIRVLADQLQWTRLALLYQYFIIGLAFIALIAFQPELRRALIRAGDVRFLRRRRPRARFIASLVESIGYLSRNKYGAIIAIQRDVGLANWAENGTQLNAEISASLLKSIFFPNSALHDLGVIIQGDRVLAAGCQFPVAESGDVDASLGSRHRAAVGLSSESDALVLIVSEETGTISFAERGKLTRFLALDDLEEELESRLEEGFSAAKRRRRAGSLSDSWRLVRRLLVVVPLTLVIWFIADQATLIPVDGVEAELDINHATNISVDTAEPTLLRLSLRGPRREIDEIRAEASEQPMRLEWTLPAAYATPGVTGELDEEQLRDILNGVPELRERSVFVESVSPGRMTFTVQEVVAIDAPVRVNAGALLVSVNRIEPDRVRVWMRAGDLNLVPEEQRFVEVPLGERLSGADRGRTLSFADAPIDPHLGGMEVLRVEPASVNVDLEVFSEKGTRRLEGIRVRLAAGPQFFKRYDVDISDANEWLIEIEVEGDKNLIENLSVQDVHAFVPLTSEQATPSEEYRSMNVVVDLPVGVSLVGAPREVRFRVLTREGVAP